MVDGDPVPRIQCGHFGEQVGYMSQTSQFIGGDNVALKVSEGQFEIAIRFFSDILKMHVERVSVASVKVKFGRISLWIDRTSGGEQGEIWLELCTDDTQRAEEYLAGMGITRCDDVEPLPPDYDGFWIRSPLGHVLLVSGPNQ